VVKPLADTRPAWKVLRVLGNLLGLPGFEQETVDEVRAEALGDVAQIAARMENAPSAAIGVPAAVEPRLERVADVPIYGVDAIVRRAPSLQLTADAAPPVVGLPTRLWQEFGARVVVSQGATRVTLPAREDPTLAPTAVRLPAPLGASMFGPLTLEAVQGGGA
jgi:NADH-quinone oxidoreductase subunit G